MWGWDFQEFLFLYVDMDGRFIICHIDLLGLADQGARWLVLCKKEGCRLNQQCGDAILKLL